MSEWRPIDTAPTDGTEVLLTGSVEFDAVDYPDHIAKDMHRTGIVIGYYQRSSSYQNWVGKQYTYEGWEPDWLTPTHWQPLPEPPHDTV